MVEFLLIAIVASITIYADQRMTGHNHAAIHNGRGSVGSVLRGTATLPAQHRVFVPWLARWANYHHVKWAAIFTSLYCSWLFFSLYMDVPALGVTLLALYFVWAALFDYTCGYFEVAFFALAFWVASLGFGYWPWLAAIGIAAGINRETSVFIPICLLLDGHYIPSALAGIGVVTGVVLPRILYRGAKRCADLCQLKNNINNIAGSFQRVRLLHNEWMSFILLTAALTAVYVTQPLSGAHYGMGAMFLLLLVPTVWGEIRVFAPVVLFAIPLIGGAI